MPDQLQGLDRYAALHAQTYGGTADAMTIPYMLKAFIAGDRGFRKGVVQVVKQLVQAHGKLCILVAKRKHWSEKTDSSISLTYQQIQKTERTVRLLGEIPTNNKHRTVTNTQQTKEVTMKKMKKTNFKLDLVASWAVALSVFVGAGGAQYICARSNASSS